MILKKMKGVYLLVMTLATAGGVLGISPSMGMDQEETMSNSKPEILQQIPTGWTLIDHNNQMTKIFKFEMPIQVDQFIQLVNSAADTINHHPDYPHTDQASEIKIILTTHHAKTRPVPYLGVNDIKLAKMIDQIYVEKKWG